MAMARRRIILVGDHRQLPHLVQRELEDELISRQSLTEAQAKAYEQSLLSGWWQLREQEKVDNIKRVVMLDTQYRMHPRLGDFISKQFYESEDWTSCTQVDLRRISFTRFLATKANVQLGWMCLCRTGKKNS